MNAERDSEGLLLLKIEILHDLLVVCHIYIYIYIYTSDGVGFIAPTASQGW